MSCTGDRTPFLKDLFIYFLPECIHVKLLCNMLYKCNYGGCHGYNESGQLATSRDRGRERKRARRDRDKDQMEGERKSEKEKALQAQSHVRSACAGVDYRFTYATVFSPGKTWQWSVLFLSHWAEEQSEDRLIS